MSHRMFNRAAGTLALLFLLPLAALIAIGIRLTSPGPVLCRQRRRGPDGAEIALWKFRTAGVDGDHRPTPFGRLLCMASLDGLPGLLNVIDGSLSARALVRLAQGDNAPQGRMAATGVPPHRVN